MEIIKTESICSGHGIRTEVPEGHQVSEIQSVEKLNEANQSPEGRDRLGLGVKLDLAGSENGVDNPRHRLAHSCECLSARPSNHAFSAKRHLILLLNPGSSH